MTCSRKQYLLIPGEVISESDGQVHHVDAWQLLDLYGVPASACTRYRDPKPGERKERYEGLTPLRPRISGDYRFFGAPPAGSTATWADVEHYHTFRRNAFGPRPHLIGHEVQA